MQKKNLQKKKQQKIVSAINHIYKRKQENKKFYQNNEKKSPSLWESNDLKIKLAWPYNIPVDGHFFM